MIKTPERKKLPCSRSLTGRGQKCSSELNRSSVDIGSGAREKCHSTLHYFRNHWVIYTSIALFTWHVYGQVKTRLTLKPNSLQIGKEWIVLCHRFVAALILMDYKAILQIMGALVTLANRIFYVHGVTESKNRGICSAFKNADGTGVTELVCSQSCEVWHEIVN